MYFHFPPIFKPSKQDEQDMWDTAVEVRMNSCDLLLKTLLYDRASVGRPTRTYLEQFCADTGCRLKDLPGAMDGRERERERERGERERERERERVRKTCTCSAT